MQADFDAQLRAWVEYFRDIGVHEFYRVAGLSTKVTSSEEVDVSAAEPTETPSDRMGAVADVPAGSASVGADAVGPLAAPIDIAPSQDANYSMATRLVSFDKLAPPPSTALTFGERPKALEAIRNDIGDCTRCPLAYAGRHKIVFGDGSPTARLMFVGEGPGADEDLQGLPFVGKAGQLLNNMIGAMGLKREDVYIANIVKCRPPNNRVPEPVEANTCSQFLLRQVDVVQPQVIVALGSTAATYLLGVKQSLSGLRGRWHSCRGAKLAVTYHPAFLLRDPRQKAEAWKDLQMVMAEMGLTSPARK